MKKVYKNPETICTEVQTNSIICASVGGGDSQGGALAPSRAGTGVSVAQEVLL